jgi:hypothetical protein
MKKVAGAGHGVNSGGGYSNQVSSNMFYKSNGF